MNPDAYFPLFTAEFFLAIQGHPEPFGWYYLNALLHYWHINHCEGIDHDDEFLKSICRCPDKDWKRFGPIIFGKFFKLCDVDGTWKQKRAREEWEKAKALQEKHALGGKRRWGKA